MGRLEFYGIAGLGLNIQGVTGGWNIHGTTGGWKVHWMHGRNVMGRLENSWDAARDVHAWVDCCLKSHAVRPVAIHPGGGGGLNLDGWNTIQARIQDFLGGG